MKPIDTEISAARMYLETDVAELMEMEHKLRRIRDRYEVDMKTGQSKAPATLIPQILERDIYKFAVQMLKKTGIFIGALTAADRDLVEMKDGADIGLFSPGFSPITVDAETGEVKKAKGGRA